MKNGSFRTPFLSHKKAKKDRREISRKTQNRNKCFQHVFNKKNVCFPPPSTGFPQPKNPGKPHEYRGCGTFPHFQHLLLLILLPCYLLYITLLYIYFRPPKSVRQRKGEPVTVSGTPSARSVPMGHDPARRTIPHSGVPRTADDPARRTIPYNRTPRPTGRTTATRRSTRRNPPRVTERQPGKAKREQMFYPFHGNRSVREIKAPVSEEKHEQVFLLPRKRNALKAPLRR